MGAQARGAQIFLLSSRGSQMGTGGSRGLNDLGRSPGLLLCCLWRVTQPLGDHLLLLCKSLPYVTCFTVGGRSRCSQQPCPTPWLGLCHLSTTLRPLRPPLHRLSLQRGWKPLPLS